MKNKIFFVIIMMLGLVLILSLSGCATVKPEEIVGKYHAQNQEDAEGVWLEIKGDNTWVDSSGASGTYKIVQEEIIFESGDEVKFSGTFVDGVLTLLKDGEIFGVWEKEIVPMSPAANAVAGIMDNAVTAAITKAAAFLNNLGIFIVTSYNLD